MNTTESHDAFSNGPLASRRCNEMPGILYYVTFVASGAAFLRCCIGINQHVLVWLWMLRRVSWLLPFSGEAMLFPVAISAAGIVSGCEGWCLSHITDDTLASYSSHTCIILGLESSTRSINTIAVLYLYKGIMQVGPEVICILCGFFATNISPVKALDFSCTWNIKESHAFCIF